MTEVKRFDCSSGGAKFCQGCYTMEECEHGDYVGYDDYARLEQECERLRVTCDEQHARDSAELRSLCAARDQYRDMSIKYGDKLNEVLKLLARCQERLDPHSDAVLWGEVCDAFKAKPCAPTK